MSPEEEKNLIILICKYGKKNKAFKIEDFYSTITGLTDSDKRFIENMLIYWGGSPDPNHIVSFASKPPTHLVTSPPQRAEYLKQKHLRLLPNALFSYIDHLEIVEARKAAETAKQQSRTAIIISVLALIVSTVLGIIEICITK
jgi:hypothetical protein